jgi:hypothetical protein
MTDKPDELQLPDEAPTVPGQTALFEDAEVHKAWEHWRGMPEYRHEDLTPWRSITVHFQSKADWDAFALLVEQPMNLKTTKSIWYPPAEIGRLADKRYIAEGDES